MPFLLLGCKEKTVSSFKTDGFRYQLGIKSIKNSYLIECNIDVKSDFAPLTNALTIGFDISKSGTFSLTLCAPKEGSVTFSTNFDFGKPGNFPIGIKVMLNEHLLLLSYTNIDVPLKPTKITTFNNGVLAFEKFPIALEWLSVENATGYQIQISSDLLFKDNIVDVTLPTNYYLFKSSIKEGNFFIRIKPLNPKFQSDFGNSICIAKTDIPTIVIPAGNFIMGRPDDRVGNADETPAHPVRLDSFHIDRYETSIRNYVLFLNCQTNLNHFRSEMSNKERCGIIYENGMFKWVEGRENYPIVFVTWFDAVAYSRWRGMRLPTEAEWEYAARSNQEYSPLPFDPFLIGKAPIGTNKLNTIAVDDFEEGKSPFGLFNVVGNVWEWVDDWYGPRFYSLNKINFDNPRGVKTIGTRVLRSGAVTYEYYKGRTTYRDHDYPTSFSPYLGFRSAKSSTN